MKFSDLYIELYVDINVNVQTFCLDDEQKEELKKHLEKYWHTQQKEALLQEANEKVFQMRLKELVDE
jgi:hypothetical protein